MPSGGKKESSQSFDSFDRGIILVDGVTSDGTPFSAGDFVGDVSEAGSLGEDPSITLLNSSASYDVWDIFAEISIPLLADKPFAEELTIDGAWRQADYSTFGNNTTYKFGGVWAPVSDIRFRATYSEAVPGAEHLRAVLAGPGRVLPSPGSPVTSARSARLRIRRRGRLTVLPQLQAVNVDPSNIFDANGNYAFEDPLSAGLPGRYQRQH